MAVEVQTGAMTAVSSRHYGCTVRKERGPAVCPGVLVPRRDLDVRILSLWRDELLAPESLAQTQQEVRKLLASAIDTKRVDAARLADKDAEIARLVDAIARMGISEAVEARLKTVERERDALCTACAFDAPPNLPSPEMIAAAYRRIVMNLKECLEGDMARARAALQKLLGEIRIVAEGDEVYAEVETRAHRLLLEAVGTGGRAGRHWPRD